jgi:antitoxin ParD1/3/4
MTISLTHDHHAWISARVASGDFGSIKEAVRQLLDERITEMSIQEDVLAWAKPYVEEALAEVARGQVMTREEHPASGAPRPAFGRQIRIASSRLTLLSIGTTKPTTPSRCFEWCMARDE